MNDLNMYIDKTLREADVVALHEVEKRLKGAGLADILHGCLWTTVAGLPEKTFLVLEEEFPGLGEKLPLTSVLQEGAIDRLERYRERYQKEDWRFSVQNILFQDSGALQSLLSPKDFVMRGILERLEQTLTWVAREWGMLPEIAGMSELLFKIEMYILDVKDTEGDSYRLMVKHLRELTGEWKVNLNWIQGEECWQIEDKVIPLNRVDFGQYESVSLELKELPVDADLRIFTYYAAKPGRYAASATFLNVLKYCPIERLVLVDADQLMKQDCMLHCLRVTAFDDELEKHLFDLYVKYGMEQELYETIRREKLPEGAYTRIFEEHFAKEARENEEI